MKKIRIALAIVVSLSPAVGHADDDSDWEESIAPINDFSNDLQRTVDDSATENPLGLFLKAAHDNVKEQMSPTDDSVPEVDEN